MNDSHRNGAPATVWSSTWIPGPPPIKGPEGADGYAVAFVDLVDGTRRQVVVATAAAPAPGVAGRVVAQPVGDEFIDFFFSDDDGAVA